MSPRTDLTAVRIDFACNDPDNGNFAGRVCQIALPDGLLELTAREWDIMTFRGCPRLIEGAGWIEVADKGWPTLQARRWHGNWCWNAYWMQDQVARQFLVWLHGLNLFDCESGEFRLFNIWNLAEPLDLEPDKASPTGLGRLLVQAMLAEARHG